MFLRNGAEVSTIDWYVPVQTINVVSHDTFGSLTVFHRCSIDLRKALLTLVSRVQTGTRTRSRILESPAVCILLISRFAQRIEGERTLVNVASTS